MPSRSLSRKKGSSKRSVGRPSRSPVKRKTVGSTKLFDDDYYPETKSAADFSPKSKKKSPSRTARNKSKSPAKILPKSSMASGSSTLETRSRSYSRGRQPETSRRSESRSRSRSRSRTRKAARAAELAKATVPQKLLADLPTKLASTATVLVNRLSDQTDKLKDVMGKIGDSENGFRSHKEKKTVEMTVELQSAPIPKPPPSNNFSSAESDALRKRILLASQLNTPEPTTRKPLSPRRISSPPKRLSIVKRRLGDHCNRFGLYYMLAVVLVLISTALYHSGHNVYESMNNFSAAITKMFRHS